MTIFEVARQFSGRRVTVVGDVMLDRYAYCATELEGVRSVVGIARPTGAHGFERVIAEQVLGLGERR